MRVDYAFLCDAATEHGGKVNALGIGIDRLRVSVLPATHPRLALVARLSFDRADAGARRFRVRAGDADGRDLLPPIEGEIRLEFPGEASAGMANLIVELVNLPFSAPGPHEVSLAVGGTELVNLPLEVERIAPA